MGTVLRGGAQDNVAAAACRGDTTGDIPKGFLGGYQPFLEGTFSNTTMRPRNLRNCLRNTALFESLVGGAKGTVLSGRGIYTLLRCGRGLPGGPSPGVP